MIYEFTPTQDLHGYDEPWPAGGSKNKLPNTAVSSTRDQVKYTVDPVSGIITANGTSDGWNGLTIGSVTLPAGTWWLSSGNTAYYAIFYMEATIGGTNYSTNTSIARKQFILSEEATFTVKLFTKGGATVNNAKCYPMIYADGETDDYIPYKNICPLSGYNIWDPSQDQMIQVYSGYVDANAHKLYLHPVYEEYDGEELVGPWMSSMDKYTEEGTPTDGAFVVDFGGEVTEYDITDFMLQTLLDSLGVRRFFASGAMLLNSLMDQAQGRVRSEAELLNRSLPLHVISIGEDLPTNLTIKKPISDVLPGLPGKIKFDRR